MSPRSQSAEEYVRLILEADDTKLKKGESELKKYQNAINQIDLDGKRMVKSQKEVNSALTVLWKDTKQLNLTTKERIALERQLWHANQRAMVGFRSMSTSMMSLQRSAGTATFALQNVGRVFQDLPYGMQGVANNIEPMVASFAMLSAQSKELNVSMVTLLKQSLLGPGGLILGFALLSGAMVGLPKLFDMLSGKVDNTEKSMMRLRWELRRISDEEYRAFLVKEQMRSQQQIREKTQKGAERAWLANYIYRMGGPAYTLTPWLTGLVGGGPSESDIKTELEASSAVAQFDEDMDRRYKKELDDAERRKKDEAQRKKDLFNADLDRRRRERDQFLGRGGENVWTFGYQQGAERFKAMKPGQKFKGGSKVGPEVQRVTEAMIELDMYTRAWQNSMRIGIMGFANDIRVGIGQAWEDVFGEANSLLERFIANTVSSFGGALAEYAGSWIFNTAIGAITGFFSGGPAGAAVGGYTGISGGMAKAGTGGLGGGSSSPAGQIYALRKELSSGAWKMKGRDMEYVVDRSKMIRSKATM